MVTNNPFDLPQGTSREAKFALLPLQAIGIQLSKGSSFCPVIADLWDIKDCPRYLWSQGTWPPWSGSGKWTVPDPHPPGARGPKAPKMIIHSNSALLDEKFPHPLGISKLIQDCKVK